MAINFFFTFVLYLKDFNKFPASKTMCVKILLVAIIVLVRVQARKNATYRIRVSLGLIFFLFAFF